MIDVRKHRSHDYHQLVRRWRAVAKAAGLPLRSLAPVKGYKTYYLKTKTLSADGGLYISAGIHGDEPAGAEGLITWAEKNTRLLAKLPCMLFPCLNPWGLVNNRRFEEAGVDMNRAFQLTNLPVIEAVKHRIKAHHFDVSLMLHEDYDGQGLYLYETERAKPYWAESLINVARKIIPIDTRTNIDGRKPTKAGIVRRKVDVKVFEEIGFPEAIHLHLYHCERTFTIETPSEFALDQRVAAQVAIIDECVKRVMKKM